MNKKDFLVEIGCEELPAKSLLNLAMAFGDEIIAELQKNNIKFGEHRVFATPRRLAVLVENLEVEQPETIVERRGPMLSSAFTPDGKPTSAAVGFAHSCNVGVEQLERLETPKGICLCYKQKKMGFKTELLLPEVVEKSLTSLPIPKLMSWGDGDWAFVRPVHWLVMLFGVVPITAEILGIKSSAETFGHRFLKPQPIKLNNPQEYVSVLEQHGYVIADFDKRKAKIRQLLENITPTNSKAIVDEELLHEVTGIVEWPVALLGKFDERFLKLPKEVLITSIQKHQKSFTIADKKNNLLPYFITFSNIESKLPERVVHGNERVINARLTDAEFFYNTDVKKSLADYLSNLSEIIFQSGLGTMYDKAQRLSRLAEFIATQIGLASEEISAKKAALLSKADLTTEMVSEFPELQGVMGYYYALQSGESEIVAMAIREHYLPSYAGDILPSTIIGSIVAIADRIDLLVGIIGINKIPTGDKDPLGLRRAVLGIIRIIIEKKINLDLKELIIASIDNYGLFIKKTIDKALEFIYERLRGYYLERGVNSGVFNAVLERKPSNLLDFNERIQAVLKFSQLSEAESLIIANKRVYNILQKSGDSVVQELREELLINTAEKELAEQMYIKEHEIDQLLSSRQYAKLLQSLVALKPSIDNFFDQVMVMIDDEKLRTNRLALLNRLRKLFLYCADISVL